MLPPGDRSLADRAWIARVHAALRAIAKQRLEKIVLTRQLILQAAGPIAAGQLLGNLLDQQPDSLVYAHGSGARVFLGATPERLVRLQAGQIEADALAGTAWHGSPTLDAPKNRHEQSLVVAAIVDALEDTFANTVILSAGDNYISGPFFGAASDPARRPSKALRDRADVELLRGDVPDPDEGW